MPTRRKIIEIEYTDKAETMRSIIVVWTERLGERKPEGFLGRGEEPSVDHWVLKEDMGAAEELYNQLLEKDNLVVASIAGVIDSTDYEPFEFPNSAVPKEQLEWNRDDVLDSVEELLIDRWVSIGIDKPHNHWEIREWVAEDIMESGDPETWHIGDFDIAFRRWIEAQSINQP